MELPAWLCITVWITVSCSMVRRRNALKFIKYLALTFFCHPFTIIDFIQQSCIGYDGLPLPDVPRQLAYVRVDVYDTGKKLCRYENYITRVPCIYCAIC